RRRYKTAHLESAAPTEAVPGDDRTKDLLKKIQDLEERLRETEARYRKVEEENKEFSNRYIEIEEQNNNLANLYVASYQLHSTLDFREVIQIVQEIVINLVGAEAFSILLLDEKTNELKSIASEGEDVMPGVAQLSTRLGEGILGTVAKTGESYYINQDVEGGSLALDKPLAAVPL